MNLRFTPGAVKDLKRLKAFIAEKYPEAAERIIASLKKSVLGLTDHSKIGRLVEGLPACRDLITRRYIVRYTVENNTVWILKIWHHKERRDEQPTRPS